jgi:hypothetical protein
MNEENQVLEEEINQQEEVAQEQEAPKNDVQINWERANDLLKHNQQRIEELERQLQQKNQPAEEADEFESLDPEDLTTNDKAKKLNRRIKDLEKTLKEQIQRNEQERIAHLESLARSKYDDYDYVVNNYAIPLIKNDPALAYKIQNSKNPVETAYKLGKLSDEFEETTVKQPINPKAEKILKNTSRPQSVHAVPESLKTQADKYSNMSPREIWEESQKYAKRA